MHYVTRHCQGWQGCTAGSSAAEVPSHTKTSSSGKDSIAHFTHTVYQLHRLITWNYICWFPCLHYVPWFLWLNNASNYGTQKSVNSRARMMWFPWLPYLTVRTLTLMVQDFRPHKNFKCQQCWKKFRIVFWDVLPCRIIVDRRFRGTCCLHHHHHPWWWRWHVPLKRRSTIILHGRRQFWTSYSPPWELEISQFWEGWSHVVKSYGVEVTFNGMSSLLNFVKIYQLVKNF
jgi:hypothetical protein